MNIVNATGGTYALILQGFSQTANIPITASPAAVQSALNKAAASIPGAIVTCSYFVVTGTVGIGAVRLKIKFVSDISPQSLLGISTSSLSGTRGKHCHYIFLSPSKRYQFLLQAHTRRP